MCEHNLTSRDYELLLDMFESAAGEYGGLDQREIYVQTKIKKLYAWSIL